jgi:hypothetical protein
MSTFSGSHGPSRPGPIANAIRSGPLWSLTDELGLRDTTEARLALQDANRVLGGLPTLFLEAITAIAWLSTLKLTRCSTATDKT